MAAPVATVSRVTVFGRIRDTGQFVGELTDVDVPALVAEARATMRALAEAAAVVCLVAAAVGAALIYSTLADD